MYYISSSKVHANYPGTSLAWKKKKKEKLRGDRFYFRSIVSALKDTSSLKGKKDPWNSLSRSFVSSPTTKLSFPASTSSIRSLFVPFSFPSLG